jgi:hypothetical protein
MLSANKFNIIFLSFLISKFGMAPNLIYQKHYCKFNMYFISIVRKEYIGLIKYIVLFLSLAIVLKTTYQKIYITQRQENYINGVFFYKNLRNKQFLFQKFIGETKKKKITLTIFLETTFYFFATHIVDVINEKYINHLPLNVLVQKIFFKIFVNNLIFEEKFLLQVNQRTLITYDFFAFFGYSFIVL